MLLAIDVGNSHTVFALFEKGDICCSWRVATDELVSVSLCLASVLREIEQQNHAIHQIDAVVCATVVPQTKMLWQKSCEQLFKISPQFIHADLDTGLTFPGYQVEKLGVDRIVNAAFAWHLMQRAVMVIDCGTATTLDVIDGSGAFLGGVIVPGVGLMRNALQEKTAQLPEVPLRFPASVLAHDTQHAIQSGVLWGYISLLEGMIRRLRLETDISPLPVVATGGFAPHLQKEKSLFDRVDSTLLLKGLHFLYQRNRGCSG
ncbi:type III pantothenate kinase [Magnetococcales bacterium HHB-1]